MTWAFSLLAPGIASPRRITLTLSCLFFIQYMAQARLIKTKQNRNARLRCTIIRRPGLSVSCDGRSEASKAAFWLTDWPD